jgi:hypothetical protein
LAWAKIWLFSDEALAVSSDEIRILVWTKNLRIQTKKSFDLGREGGK